MQNGKTKKAISPQARRLITESVAALSSVDDSLAEVLSASVSLLALPQKPQCRQLHCLVAAPQRQSALDQPGALGANLLRLLSKLLRLQTVLGRFLASSCQVC